MKNNPFTDDKDRAYIWEMLVERDIKAFVGQDWEMVANDFVVDGFTGIDAGKQHNIDTWELKYPSLESYQEEWLKQAKEFGQLDLVEDKEDALHRVTILQQIEIKDDFALLHKKFYGPIKQKDGTEINTDWQTLYRCRKVNGVWKICGFTGYIPLLQEENSISKIGKNLPKSAGQHKTAGPYSPVLEINPGKLVVISGQAAIDKEGNVIGDTIEDQTAYTLDNCSQQLATAGCSLQNVFKVNVYLKDINDWPRFNEVYKHYFQDPKPVRTAVESGLLMTLLVEVEMWAVKN
ncbi:RidA family protein [Flagellimonas sp. S3867]|uniref:RidA family protein n=1 Tax=Flagellimonas sp. S3867 TaxID=2768063 RepID=UPI00168A2F77|nr:RidA family protein [Flagellimonas sp. S3867]